MVHHGKAADHTPALATSEPALGLWRALVVRVVILIVVRDTAYATSWGCRTSTSASAAESTATD